MSEAQRAREAALPMEAKKDSLRQTQDGLWKVTFTVKHEDMHPSILQAPMGTRYQLAAVEIDDDEQPIDREDTPGQRAKKHFEASCQDGDFKYWVWDNCRNRPEFVENETYKGARDWAKHMMGIQSANELIDNPEPWNRLWTEYQYRDMKR